VSNPKQHSVFKAVLVNFFNPNPYLGWSLVMGPLLIKGWNENPVNGFILLSGFYSSMIIYSIGMIFLFAVARNFGSRVSRVSVGISVIALLLFGLYEFWAGITEFL
jgi:threonine/homoserine/homoserine lactone efflux protein